MQKRGGGSGVGPCGMRWLGWQPSGSFRLRAGVPGEEAGQLEERIPAARVGQSQGLRGRLLPGTLLGHGQEVGGLGGERRGRGAAGAAAASVGW